jgi:hypothetical protein
MTQTHRNVRARHFCPACEHSHFPNGDPKALGMCLKHPPTMVHLGFIPEPAPVVAPGAPPRVGPPLNRAWFPPVARDDTCSQWEQRAEGSA